MRPARQGGAARALALLLGACPGGPGAGGDDPLGMVPEAEMRAASRQQAAEISDRRITPDEYHASFRRYRECLRAGGYDLRDVRVESDGLYQFGVPDAAVRAGVDEECYLTHWKLVDNLWQIAMQDRSQTTQALRDCLTRRGIAPREDREGIDQQMREAGIAFPDCFR